MLKAKNGQKVKVHYRGTLDDGTEFDNSHYRDETLDFEIGSSMLLPDFEAAVLGMSVGEKKTFRLEEAYGAVNPDALVSTSKDKFPNDFDFNVGETVYGASDTGAPMAATIASVEEDAVVLDHNHPLAGKHLNFEVELIELE